MSASERGFTFTVSQTHTDRTLKQGELTALADTCVTAQVRQEPVLARVGEQGGRAMRNSNGLAEDCEIAVCQGKTRGQLWAPVDGRVGRYSWKDAAQGRLRRRLARARPRNLFGLSNPTAAPPPLSITIFHTCIKVSMKGCASVCFPSFFFSPSLG